MNLNQKLIALTDDEGRLALGQQCDWMKTTQIAVVVSEEQGEVEKFRRWNLDIRQHRRLIKQGFETDDGQRLDVENRV